EGDGAEKEADAHDRLADALGSLLVARKAPEDSSDRDHERRERATRHTGQVVEDVLKRRVPRHLLAARAGVRRRGDESEGEKGDEKRTQAHLGGLLGEEGSEWLNPKLSVAIEPSNPHQLAHSPLAV